MEITEPVIIRITQTRKRGKRLVAEDVELEIGTRADARALIAAIARRMTDLPDDGNGLITPVTVDNDGVIDATIYCGAVSPWGEECPLEEHPPAEPHVDTKDREWGGEPKPRTAPVGEPASQGCPECGVSGGRHLGNCKTGAKLAALGERVAKLSEPAAAVADDQAAAVLAESIRAGTPLVVTEDDPCECSHTRDSHRDEDRCQFLGCDCTRYRPQAAATPPEPPRVPLASVTPLPLRPDYEVIPELQKPCPEAHPTRGTLCTGKIPHAMPHADPDGETWVTAPLAVSS